MKRLGYTLSEVLITLGIVGVISVMTVPSLFNEYNKQIYAKTLSVAVADFETAMKNMLYKEDAEDLLETASWKGIESSGVYTLSAKDGDNPTFRENLNKYLPIEKFNTNLRTYDTLGAKPGIATNEANSIWFSTQKGLEYIIYVNAKASSAKTESDLVKGGYTYKNKAADVCIDVNGGGKPNIIGRDFFCYELSVDGNLHPLGGYEYLSFNSKTLPAGKTVTVLCKTSRDGIYCAEYLKQNNYKMDY